MEYTKKERLQVLKLIKASKYFKLKDFTCKCSHCRTESAGDKAYYERTTRIRLHAFNKLAAFRKAINSHIKLNSAYRCPEHPEEKKKSGAKWQGHLEGAAFDVRVTNHFSRAKTIILSIKAGFIGIGINNTYVHIDGRSWEAVYLYPEAT